MKRTELFLFGLVFATSTVFPARRAAADVIAAMFRPDTPFPEYNVFWNEGGFEPDNPQPAHGAGVRLGGSLHVYLRNTGRRPIEIADAALEDVSLSAAVTYSEQRKRKKFASIYFSKLPPAAIKRLVAAGEPIWWKIDPKRVVPGDVAEITIRLRQIPESRHVKVSVKHTDGVETADVAVLQNAPRFEGISFSSSLDTVLLFVRGPDGATAAPTTVRLDHRDVTAMSRIAHDPHLNMASIVIALDKPLATASYHCFQAAYADGRTALAGLRAASAEIAYGMWGGPGGKSGDTNLARDYIQGLADHNLNLQMPQLGSKAVQTFLKRGDGRRMMKSLGLGAILSDPGKFGIQDPYAYFIHDEPDAGDYRMKGVPENKKIGGLAQWAISRADDLRHADPRKLQMLNVDMTFKPYNWYTYGQLPDILAADPYYQARLSSAYWKHPERIPLYEKATYIYAVGSVCQSACSPRPLHLILNAVCPKEKDTERVFRFATPPEKRIEVFYAVAAGAKGLSYWWYTPSGRFGGVGAHRTNPDAAALWREIGLIGAEVRTLGPLLTTSCPIQAETKTTEGLWSRCLAARNDTLILVLVNDRYRNDDKGTDITPLPRAELAVRPPAWITPVDAFKLTPRGTADVKHETSRGLTKVDLGRLDVACFVIITADRSLREQMQAYYQARFAGNVKRLLRD